MYHYRLLFEFAHDLQREQFEDFMEHVVKTFMETMGVDSTEFIQDVYIVGEDVTEEHDEITGVAELRAEMDSTDAVDRFIHGTHFKDYPPPED